ncbi:DNA starvation/stationary phase protection protein [Bacillus sp. ISL-47]|uniref:Dps family protein n=1 Tax=Bacillus sp. ISL-47 TaxID=2819130 RepID=UPI001BEB9C4E|nr:DNA starvation/stationary phase protection protein [Bacillus sp. ISL-47]MBT2687705.1 DNA starvation/stationary phase protection protein [Bacillus sp. ISL-47]MBT2707420.1 DNA starvation/stationary phase protection protein [Pseudomonas sp. ISL-84]
MEKLYSALNVQIANWSVLYTKLHRYHWFVKGPLFFTLHEKFEELYNEAAEVIDEAAERLLAIGGTPAATLKEYLSVATLEESNGESKAEDMVASLAADYKHLKEQLISLAQASEDHEDQVTADFAIGLIEKLDTHIWMLNAYLGE